MDLHDFTTLTRAIERTRPAYPVGRISRIDGSVIEVEGVGQRAALGDGVEFHGNDPAVHKGEVVALSRACATVFVGKASAGLRLGLRARLAPPPVIRPADSWLGRVIDPDGTPLDGRPLLPGPHERSLLSHPPEATSRRALGQRIATGLAVFDTFLPLVRGQRIGLFAGSGVGKSSLLSALARGVETDVSVIALVGERGREVRSFIEKSLGPEGLARSVVIVATSDQPALTRRRAVLSALGVAEHFRDSGRQVLFLVDSLTRTAEAHREIACRAGEPATLGDFPASLIELLSMISERAGPGVDGTGDITAVFAVLVAASDMEGTVADTLRGMLDGHVVLSRSIAERGRFPSIDLLRSVSRSLPEAASRAENDLLTRARALLAAYEGAEVMIRAGLYEPGSDPRLDEAIRVYPGLDSFLATQIPGGTDKSFERLAQILQGQPEP